VSARPGRAADGRAWGAVLLLAAEAPLTGTARGALGSVGSVTLPQAVLTGTGRREASLFVSGLFGLRVDEGAITPLANDLFVRHGSRATPAAAEAAAATAATAATAALAPRPSFAHIESAPIYLAPVQSRDGIGHLLLWDVDEAEPLVANQADFRRLELGEQLPE